jgi:coiled-coil and C2 domain-containing protein 2A
MNTEGKSVLVTRYLRAIRPPEDLIENGDQSFVTMLNVAKFVTMIPFVADSLIFPGISDIWSTCDVSTFELDIIFYFLKVIS